MMDCELWVYVELRGSLYRCLYINWPSILSMNRTIFLQMLERTES